MDRDPDHCVNRSLGVPTAATHQQQLTMRVSVGFFYEMVSHWGPQAETKEWFRKTNVLYSQVLETEDIAQHPVPRGKTPGESGGRRQEAGEHLDRGLYWGFCRRDKAGQVNSLGLAGLNNFSELWAIGMVSSCLVPGLRIIKAKEYHLLGCRGQIEEARLLIA